MNLQLQLISGNGKAPRFEHAGGSVLIGRDPHADLAVTDPAWNNVSWHHASIDQIDGASYLSDLGSTNGTFLNRERLAPQQRRPLHTGDEIQLGAEGPRYKVLGLKLPAAAAFAVPQAAGPSRTSAVSATRQLLIRSQAKNRASLWIATATGLMLLLVLAIFLFWNHLRTRNVETRIDDVDKTLAEHTEKFHQVGEQIEKSRRDVLDELEKQRDTAVKQAAAIDDVRQAQAAQGKKIDAIDRRVLNMKDLNDQLANAAPPNPAEKGNRAAPAAPEPGPEAKLEPGMKVGVRLRNSANKEDYAGSLVEATPGKLTVRIGMIGDKTFKPTDVHTLYTPHGAFRFDESTGRFESAMVHYQFNPELQFFEIVRSSPSDLFMSRWGVIEGDGEYRCLVSEGPSGRLCISLPIGSGSPQLDPNRYKTIISDHGIYEYASDKQGYVFTSAKEIVAKRQVAKDKAQKEYEEKVWQRRVESFKLWTERYKATRPIYWWRWL